MSCEYFMDHSLTVLTQILFLATADDKSLSIPSRHALQWSVRYCLFMVITLVLCRALRCHQHGHMQSM